MPAAKLNVMQLSRRTASGATDSLQFKPGVNVLVGVPNTGKTKWLGMLDYLMGKKGSPEESLGEDLAEKYASASCMLSVDGTEILLERHWRKYGARGTVFVNEAPVKVEDFDIGFLEMLGIPLLHYPQGNPYSPRSWPRLGWRSLLRHVYRRQYFWSDIADKQPESEQHAVLMQFVGAAEALFSEQFGTLVQAEKKLSELKAQRRAFATLLEEVSAEIVGIQGTSVSVTPTSVEEAVGQILTNIEELERAREAVITQASADAENEGSEALPLAESLRAAIERIEALEAERSREVGLLRLLERRGLEMADYASALEGEQERLARASSAVNRLGELRITHCPACDEPVNRKVSFSPSCYLCDQPVPSGDHAEGDGGVKRVRLEVERVENELSEARDLLAKAERECAEASARVSRIADLIEDAEATMRPLQNRVVRALPSHLSEVQVALGREEERLLQWKRIRRSMDKRQHVIEESHALAAQIEELQQEVETAQALVDFEGPAETLGEGMNMYLNALNDGHANAWTQRQVKVRMSDRRAAFLVGDRQWTSQLGGTLRLYFLLSYHYGLLHLSAQGGSNHPGCLILDFPPELDDGSKTKDKENFVLEPFVQLLDRDGYESCQVIAAGNAFEGLRGAHRIELREVWR